MMSIEGMVEEQTPRPLLSFVFLDEVALVRSGLQIGLRAAAGHSQSSCDSQNAECGFRCSLLRGIRHLGRRVLAGLQRAEHFWASDSASGQPCLAVRVT